MPRPGGISARLFDRYIRGQARRSFTAVHWAREGLTDPGPAPSLYVANHTSWWDGFLAWLVTYRMGQQFHILMEARHLARYPLFRRFGALPLDRASIRQGYRDLAASVEWIRAGSSLWVFPQGFRQSPARPIVRCERGAAHLALRHGGPLRIVPVGFRYAFLGEQLPEAFILLGSGRLIQPGEFRDRASVMTLIEEQMRMTLSALDELVQVERVEAFETLVAGRLSVNKRMDRFRHAVGLLHGPFDARNG